MLKGRMKSLRLYLISSATRTTALLTIKPCCFSSCKIAHETALLVYLLLQMVLFFFVVIFAILWKMEVIQPVLISEPLKGICFCRL